MSRLNLIIEGARQNNLKNISITLPHNKIIAITGLSGSGKSSLAFDTIFAEGQWRFIESLSTYTRMFVKKLDRPDVDAIYNIRPSIALEQKNPIKTSRSTVGTLTEIYDILRIIFSKVATPYCPKCGKEIVNWNPSTISSQIIQRHLGKKALIIFQTYETISNLKQKGFSKIWIDYEIEDIDEFHSKKPLSASETNNIEIVLDRLIITNTDNRLSDSIELAWKEGKGIKIAILKNQQETRYTGNNEYDILNFSSKNLCDDCYIPLPEPTPITFSFNHPLYACHRCKGFGNILIYDEALIIPDKNLSLLKGAISMWEGFSYLWWKKQMLKGLKKSCIDTDKPFNKLSFKEKEIVFKGNEYFYGINNFFEEMENKRYKLHIRIFLNRYRKTVQCPLCKGKRLSQTAISYKINNKDIMEISDMTISSLLKWIKNIELSQMKLDIIKEALGQITQKLIFLEQVGVGYIALNRQVKTISGGEYQRINLSNQLALALTGTLYVLDEPTIGLHPRDTKNIINIMKRIVLLGNTIIVVEHDKDVIKSSDWVVEIGPGGGKYGGYIVFCGQTGDFLKAKTITSQYVSGDISKDKNFNKPIRDFNHNLSLKGASGNNLKGIDINIPIGALSVVTGVSGSGKSSLIIETLYKILARHFRIRTDVPLHYKEIEGIDKIKGVRLIDQSSTSKTPRSVPVTYLKMFDQIRKVFSKQQQSNYYGYKTMDFSFNTQGGRCETCKGNGYQGIKMYFFEDLYVKCEDCKGKRYKEYILKIHYKGKNIYDILNLTVDEAIDIFSENTEINKRLSLMKEIGLGYLVLGQPLNTLSGGESQRIKICSELLSFSHRKRGSNPLTGGIVYIFDEPTIGLHYQDILLFLKIIKKMTHLGHTVIIIEHNLDVINKADWVIDLGPEGGDDGGNVVFEGTPQGLINIKNSYTGKFLKKQKS